MNVTGFAKKLLKALLLIAIVLVIVALIAPYIIPVGGIKNKVIAAVEKETGKKMQIGGELHFVFLPHVAIKAGDVMLSAPSAMDPAKEEVIASLKALDLQIDAVDYIAHGKLTILSLSLEQPEIHLTVNDKNIGNWQMTAPPAQAAAQEEDTQTPANKKASAAPFTFSLNDLKIHGGHLTYTGADQKTLWDIKDLDLTTSAPDLSTPMKAEGSASINGRKLSFSGATDSLNQLLSGTGNIEVSAKTDDAALYAKGQILSPMTFKGAIDVASSSLKDTINWAAPGALPANIHLPEKIEISGNAQLSAALVNVQNAKITMDKNELAGSFGYEVAQGLTPPVIMANFKADALDISPYVTLPGQKQAGLFILSPAMAETSAGWSTEPIDLAFLRSLEAQIDLHFSSLTCAPLLLGKGELGITLKYGRLTLDLPNTLMYEGKGWINLIADAATHAISTSIDLANVEVENILSALANYNGLSGRATGTINLATHGKSEQEFASNLAGNGTLRLQNGALTGYDFNEMVRNVKTALRPTKDASKKTEFSDASGTFMISQGTLTNNDLVVNASQLRLRGNGTVSMANRTLNYRLTPMLVDTSRGGKDGLGLPLVVSGGWDALLVQPDLRSALENAVRDPQQLQEQLKSPQIKNAVKDIKGLFKGR